jgi:hypothetical protein
MILHAEIKRVLRCMGIIDVELKKANYHPETGLLDVEMEGGAAATLTANNMMKSLIADIQKAGRNGSK